MLLNSPDLKVLRPCKLRWTFYLRLQHSGLVSKIARANKRQKGADSSDAQKVKATDVLEDVAKTAGVDCRDLEAALIKLHNEHYRKYSKCPGGLKCTALQVEGGGKGQVRGPEGFSLCFRTEECVYSNLCVRSETASRFRTQVHRCSPC